MTTNTMTIIRGTTPTIKYVFKVVDVSDITAAYLTITGFGNVEKNLSAATVGEDSLSWTLTQAETFALQGTTVKVQLNWKTSDGTRGASVQERIQLANNSKNEVI